MANEQNLIPVQSGKEAREKGRNGGIKSGEVRRARKSMREMLDYLLSKTTKNSQGEEVSYQEGMLISAINKALKGDIKSMEFLRDTVGEKPTDNIVQTSVTKYITQEEQKATNEHIDEVINGTR